MIKLETRHLSYSYHAGKPVLKDISLTVHGGTITILLGMNGSGKTTLIKVLAGLLMPLKGTTFIEGKDIAHRGQTNSFRHAISASEIAPVCDGYSHVVYLSAKAVPH